MFSFFYEPKNTLKFFLKGKAIWQFCYQIFIYTNINYIHILTHAYLHIHTHSQIYTHIYYTHSLNASFVSQ